MHFIYKDERSAQHCTTHSHKHVTIDASIDQFTGVQDSNHAYVQTATSLTSRKLICVERQ